MADTSDQEQTVAGLGEAGVLKRILPRLRGAEMLLGPGDDAAIIAAPGGRFVFSIDTMVQDQDFRLIWPNGHVSTGYDVGWKSAAQNLSDVNAMGAKATSAVISLTLPPSTKLTWIEGFADGFSAAVRELGAKECAIAGGDLSSGKELSVSTAVTGRLSWPPAILRSGAQPGDVIAVSGALGAAAAGLHVLETVGMSYDDEKRFIISQLRPRPNLEAGPAAARCGATAMMDVSDGLLRDIPRLAVASGVGVELVREKLAEVAGGGVSSWAKRHGFDAQHFVLRAAEDFSLLATFPPSVTMPPQFTSIGSIIPAAAAGELWLDGHTVGTQGWDHFMTMESEE